jgi:hypothetical protein|tara:strand:+ start:278 stop:499 length:222 start_codon:yes stop_codon:yes gene_type:complete
MYDILPSWSIYRICINDIYIMNNFRKVISILEVPLLLMIIGMISLEEGNTIVSILLFAVSIVRLWVNHITYKE